MKANTQTPAQTVFNKKYNKAMAKKDYKKAVDLLTAEYEQLNLHVFKNI